MLGERKYPLSVRLFTVLNVLVERAGERTGHQSKTGSALIELPTWRDADSKPYLAQRLIISLVTNTKSKASLRLRLFCMIKYMHQYTAEKMKIFWPFC